MASGFTPVDESAERAVLAAILTSPDAFADVTEILQPEDFGLAAHAEIYRSCIAADAAGRPVDRVTVAADLKRHRRLSSVGGEVALAALVAEADNADAASAHAEIVAERSLLRRLVDTGRSIAGEAMAAGADAKAALSLAEEQVFQLGVEKRKSSMSEMPAAVAETMELLLQARTSVLVGTSTGFRDLDRMTGGLTGGQLVIVAARPSMGKSAYALQLAVNMAKATGAAVPFLSYEMSTSELTMRLLSTELRYDLLKLRSGDIPDGMDVDLSSAAERISQLSLLVDDNPPETIAGVRSAMRRLRRRGPIGGIVIDYLQLMSGDGNGRDDNRQQEISVISRGLKRLASELDVPVIALSQLNRSLEARPNKRPMLSDLRDSGSIEQDASIVLMLYRDSVYHEDADATLGELIIAKQRSGPTGTIYLDWEPTCARFSDTDRKPAGNGGGGGYGRGSGGPF